jgi:hypothetical protein
LACAIAVIYAFAMLSTARAWPARLLLGIAILTCGAALYFTGTRAAILGLVVGLAVLVCSLAARPDSRRFIALAATVALSLVVIAAPFAIGLIHAETEDRFQAESASSALADRQRSIDGVIRTFGERPFGFGLGVTGAGGRLAPEYRWFSIDNVYFTALYETGTIGLLALLAAHGSLLFLTLRFAYRAKSRQLGIAYGSFAAAHVSLLVAGWFDQGAFDYAPLAQMFWLFAGSIALPARLEEASPDAVQSQKRLVPSRSAILRPLGDPRRIQLVTRMRSPGAAALAVKPLTEADIEAAVARFNARLRERLLELAQAGHWSQYSADELFGRAGRELFIDMKKELARLETDPFSSDAARAVIGSAVEIASLMMMLADKFSTEPPSGAQ